MLIHILSSTLKWVFILFAARLWHMAMQQSNAIRPA